jgi:hypothetical protein
VRSCHVGTEDRSEPPSAPSRSIRYGISKATETTSRRRMESGEPVSLRTAVTAVQSSMITAMIAVATTRREVRLDTAAPTEASGSDSSAAPTTTRHSRSSTVSSGGRSSPTPDRPSSRMSGGPMTTMDSRTSIAPALAIRYVHRVSGVDR